MEIERSVFKELKTLDKLVVKALMKDKKTIEKDLNLKTKLTYSQMEIMGYILGNLDQDIYQRDLEKVLNLRRATISGVLQTMERNKLIERVVDNEDSRSKKIILHHRAREIYLKNRQKMQKLEDNTVKGIPKEDLKIFFTVIEKMKQNITKEV